LLDDLRASAAEFFAATGGVTETQAKFKPRPDRWSIAECAEHVATVENGYFRFLTTQYTEGAPASPSGGPPRDPAAFRARQTDRSNRMQAPERARPAGRDASLAASVERFRAGREAAIGYAATCQDDLDARSVTHALFGAITCYEGLLFLAGHALRHVAQIREIKSDPTFPAA
jgi:DinB superfamily